MSNKKILMIIAPKNFREEELQEPLEIFKNAGHNVTIASVTKETCRSMFGLSVKPDQSVDEIKVGNYDAVVLVGGAGSPALKKYPSVLKVLKESQSMGKVLGAICLAPTVLAKADLLKERKATVFSSGIEEIKKAGAEYVSDEVVVDGNLVTGDGPNAATSFAHKILERLD
ncbi:MAG: DJ-1/PfpI/YhbO family deglycase/protease [Methanosarcinales archaeon]